ncbi:deoxynucleoside kinase [candidate division KSB1 bacterium]
MRENQFSYIAIDGLICTGKTHLAELLAKKLNATPVFEKFDENPFLENFYANPQYYSFPAELFFLISRYQQLSQYVQTDLFNTFIISDYMFEKNKIFASVTLNEQEHALYYNISELLVRNVPKPDMILFLQANIPSLMDRIRERGREWEKSITEQYLKLLNEAYNSYFFHAVDTPVLVLNVSNLHFEEDSADLLWLLQEIEKPFKGIRYINPER